MMSVKADFVVTRTQATRGVQDRLAPGWVWEEKTVAAWDLSLTTEETLENLLIGQQRGLSKGRASADDALDDLHDMNAQVLAMARSKYRNDPETLALLDGLDTEGDARREILSDAQGMIAVWQKLPDEDWSPTPTNTLDAFTAQYTLGKTKVDALEGLQADVRKTRKQYHNHVAQMWEDCVAWYESACAVFAEGTPEGAMVRGIATEPAAAPSTGTGGTTGGGEAPPGV